ncbi:ArsR/SmtB family transcription factor [Actinopolymorpha alba]|uniref:ArsR/SmtB family transcription factor n=1 Tax=Actinopolymorpha alba TaxID=533267 RepID=UPI000376CB20|nr:metalloregulator ArsR/SmtB family transcription factor [Actinopolymorpha alba]
MEATSPHIEPHSVAVEPSDDQVRAATAVFGMLSDPTRLRILWVLRDGAELDVTSLAQHADVGATAASQHLMKLRLAGLVTTRKEGRRVFYRVRGGHLRRLLAEALFHTDHQLSGQPDHD